MSKATSKTIEFLKTCKQNITDDTVLVTFDACSLCTNIPHEFRLRAIEYFVSYYRQSINSRFTTQFILEAASFILSNNSITFDEMFCLQIQGPHWVQFLPRHTLHYQWVFMK